MFKARFGNDVITDFKVGDSSTAEHDVLQFDKEMFAGTTDAARFADLIAHTSDVNGSAVIKVGMSDTITLQSVTKAQLQAHDYDFAFI